MSNNILEKATDMITSTCHNKLIFIGKRGKTGFMQSYYHNVSLQSESIKSKDTKYSISIKV